MSDPIVVLDGGMSRELMRLKAPFRQPEWSALALMESPQLVRQVHAEYADAGADVLTTNSYALVPFHINEDRFWSRGEELSTLAGRLAREAADDVTGRKVTVAGSLPPMFGSYEPDLFDATTVQERLAVLVRGLSSYVDLWLGETLSLIAEAEAVRVATKQTGKPLWISFTLQDAAPARLRSGEAVVDAARWALKAGVQAMLFNCSQPEYMNAAVQDAQRIFANGTRAEGTTAPLIGVYANAFEPKVRDDAANVGISSTRADMTAEKNVDFARQWIESGARIVGGCCGIGCDHIRHLSAETKQILVQ